MLHQFNKLSIPLKISLSFLVTVLIGSGLLSLPISQAHSSEAVFFDHLFTAISMVCVTGLYTQPVYLTYNLFGQVVSMILMSIGGLGILTIIAYLYYAINERVSFSEQVAVTEALNRESVADFKPFIKSVFKFVAMVEVVGALLLMTYFIPDLGWKKGAFTSAFLSISAFNNAGFDNLGPTSLIAYSHVTIINIVIPILIIFGGLGFSVWNDLKEHFKQATSWEDYISPKHLFRRLSLSSKVAITVTGVLLLSGTVLFYLLEVGHTMVGSAFVDQLKISFFQSTTMRTAGFATVNYTKLHTATLLICTIFMFIGGSPGGTAGGVKTTTCAIIGKMILSEMRGEQQVIFFRRLIDKKAVQKSLIIAMTFLAIIVTSIIAITLLDSWVDLEFVIFEVVSALATVGVTADLTPELSRMSQTIIMVLMFIGRVGPITIFTALKLKKSSPDVQRATGQILIG